MTDSYRDALASISARADYGRGFVSDPFWGDEAARVGLRRMAALLDRLGRPDLEYPIIHVAGSKGKGSTCAFAASMLTDAGYRVGLTMSPHLHTFRERIVVAGEMISADAFGLAVERVNGAASSIEKEAPSLARYTAFELLTAIALDHFAAVGCNVAIVEVGIGGALDSTNVVTPAVSVITPLDYEHTAVLGTTLAEIAANKAGIIKPGLPAVVAEQPAEAMAVIEAEAGAKQSPLFAAGRDWRVAGDWRRFDVRGRWGRWRDLRSGIAGDHQKANAALALAAVLSAGEGFSLTESDVRRGLLATRLPGRFETVMVDGQAVVLDGAHTPLAIAALVTTLREASPRTDVILVLGVAEDKEIDEMVGLLAPLAKTVVVTRSRSPRAAETEGIARAFLAHGASVTTAPDVAGALSLALSFAYGENLILVTGSFNVVAEAREALGLAAADPPV